LEIAHNNTERIVYQGEKTNIRSIVRTLIGKLGYKDSEPKKKKNRRTSEYAKSWGHRAPTKIGKVKPGRSSRGAKE